MITEFQQEILYQIMSEVFSADINNFNQEIEVVITKNRELLGPSSDYGFYFGKNWYSVRWASGRTTQSLHPDLYPKMIQLETRKKTMDDDWNIINQVFCRILSPFHTYQDIRDELPEVLVNLVPSLFEAYPRRREPVRSIQSDPMAVRQYEKVLNKIHSYVAMRYIL